MLGILYGEIFLILGASAALIGPKDLPLIARTAGRLVGRAVGHGRLVRGQFENVMQQSQARQVHKEFQDKMAQVDAICYEIQSISIFNPGPLTKRLEANLDHTSASRGNKVPEKLDEEDRSIATISKDCSSMTSGSCNVHSLASTYARLAETPAIKNCSATSGADVEKLNDGSGLLSVLPVSAESTGLLPNRLDVAEGSDIVLEAILEAEVAHNAKGFFAQPQNQIKYE